MKINKQITITILIIVGVIALALILSPRLGNATPRNSIQINGQASLDVVPDLITVYYSVETQAKTSEDAENKNSEIVQKLEDNVVSAGFSENELKTQSFSIYPEYSWANNKQTLIGYRAVHSLKMELPADESEKISDLIDAGTEAGAGISYINFELSDALETQSKTSAIKLAAEDAKIKAEALAEGMDKKVGRLISVSLSDFSYYPWNIYSYAGGEDVALAKESVRSITPSEQKVSAYVTAVYKLR